MIPVYLFYGRYESKSGKLDDAFTVVLRSIKGLKMPSRINGVNHSGCARTEMHPIRHPYSHFSIALPQTHPDPIAEKQT